MVLGNCVVENAFGEELLVPNNDKKTDFEETVQLLLEIVQPKDPNPKSVQVGLVSCRSQKQDSGPEIDLCNIEFEKQ